MLSRPPPARALPQVRGRRDRCARLEEASQFIVKAQPRATNPPPRGNLLPGGHQRASATLAGASPWPFVIPVVLSFSVFSARRRPSSKTNAPPLILCACGWACTRPWEPVLRAASPLCPRPTTLCDIDQHTPQEFTSIFDAIVLSITMDLFNAVFLVRAHPPPTHTPPPHAHKRRVRRPCSLFNMGLAPARSEGCMAMRRRHCQRVSDTIPVQAGRACVESCEARYPAVRVGDFPFVVLVAWLADICVPPLAAGTSSPTTMPRLTLVNMPGFGPGAFHEGAQCVWHASAGHRACEARADDRCHRGRPGSPRCIPRARECVLPLPTCCAAESRGLQ